MSNARRLLKPALAVVFIACFVWFFVAAFRRNWASLREHEFHIAPLFMGIAALATLATTLLATFAWYRSMNALSTNKIDFKQTVAATNVSGLSKYVPGKVWSYALQMYWLDGLGVSKALTLYVNLVNQLISIGVSLMFGLSCLLFARVSVPSRALLGGLVGLIAFDAVSILYNHAILNGLVSLINRIFKRSLSPFEVKKRLLVELHLIHLAAALASGVAAYSFCFALGYRVDVDRGSAVVGASLVGDVAGFLAFVVPGGLGVREGLMYAILGGQSAGSLALILPVASRLMNMFVEIMLGLVALRLLRTLTRRPTPTA